MDRSNPHESLFSRGGPSPPLGPQHPQYASLLPKSSSSSPNHIDSLFHNMSAPSSNQQINSGVSGSMYGNPALATSNMSVNEDAVSSSGSAPVNSTADRQSALLSLLGSVSPSGGSGRGAGGNGPTHPQQVPTPPGSSQRTGNSPLNNDNETQGKYLLEQLMSGNTPQSSYVKAQPHPLAGSAPSPPYIQQPSEPSIREGELYQTREASYQLQDTPRELPQRPQPLSQQQQPPSPTRKSMFDFVSPFDALAPSATSAVKKKPLPQTADVSSGNEDSWTSASMSSDPKRKSVENLMDQLTRGPVPHQVQTSSPSYDNYLTGEEYAQNELLQPRAAPPPPLPPKPTRSPRLSPPKVPAQRQQQQPSSFALPSMESLVSPTAAQGPALIRKDKTGSPAPRSNLKPENKGKGTGVKGKAATSHSQTIIYDVSQPLEEIQAPRDTVKSTAIALVRQDSVFLPGTTIGATHWVAYAMTKGRVRVISRSSGDRTLLQLPPAFPNTTSVTDMAVYGNRLAGVTSDGGFVVWELPEVIHDDVPGQLLLCIAPGALGEGLHSVKWHPKQSETLAVASDSKIFLLELGIVARTFRGSPLPPAELHRIAQVFAVPSRLVAFDFDVLHYALATISEDSTLTLWNIPDKLPFWSHKVRGDDVPSSITFVDDGIVIGRKNGTVFQLLSVVSKNVLATIKFVNGHQEDSEMFGHVNYDSRVQTLWVANSRRDSMIAFKIGYDNSTFPTGEVKGAYFEQVVEFIGPKPTIHFVILSAEADPTGEEAHAACVAAKVPPGELALVAFSVHSTGVDQILIRQEWFDVALEATAAKYPTHSLPNPPQGVAIEARKQLGPRVKTPPLKPPKELEGDSHDEDRGPDAKGRKNGGAAKQKNVVFKDSDDNGKDKEKKEKNVDTALINESALGQALSREIKKSEDSLHTRIGRLIGKEMDKQHHRLEDARAHEQAEDFTRQEKILKLISTELTRNTTRVVEMAVKAEVQNSVLPALESITRVEVRSALNEHVGGGLASYVQQSLPNEIEKLLLRPDISKHFASILSSNLNPLIERYVKDSVSKTFIPAYSQQSSAMHQELIHELRTEILKVKKESIAWQNEALRGQESLIRDLEHSVRSLSDQVKFLTMNVPSIGGSHLQHQHANSPGPSGQHHQASQLSQSHLRQPPATQPASNYSQTHPPFQQQSPASGMHSQWFSSGIAAPQASHPLAPPPPPPPPPPATQSQRTPPAPAQSEEWDDTYLAVLGTQDPRQLRELLSRSNPEVIMPLSGPGPLSQAVILTLLHRLAAIVGETPPHEEIFKQSLWWLQRTASALNTNDPLISPYIARVVPNVQQMLNTTKSRCAILPGGPPLVDAVRTLSDIQDTLSRKPA